MTTITLILGMERFNAHVWRAVEQDLRASGLDVELRRFHDGHVEARDPQLAAAIAAADVLFVTLINMREQADWLGEQLAQSHAGAVFAFESMPEVMALTRVGEYRVSGGKSSLPKPMQAVLKLITRGREEDTLYAYTKLTKLTSKLLPLMPAKLKDFRTWLSVNLYWNQPDVYNLTQMLRLILRDCLGWQLEVAPLRSIPTMGCFHPAAREFFSDPQAYLRWYKRFWRDQGTRSHNGGSARPTAPRPFDQRPLIALIAFRKHVVQNQRYLGELVQALEAEGLAVLPIFVSGIELHVAVREWLLHQPVDMLINAMGFALVGGPAGSTKPGHFRDKAADLLAGLDVPYMVAQPLQMQDEADWRARGVAPMQAVIMYDLPEMDGSTAPVALGAIREQQIVATPDRLARAARQVAGWTRLRRTPPAQRKLALVLYNFPPGLGRIGTAALLDVPATLQQLLVGLKARGYHIPELPTAEQLAQRIAALEEPSANPRHQLKLAEYRKLLPTTQLARIESRWGRAPGELGQAGADALRIDGFAIGNLFIGVQPPMGVPGDPMRLLFDPHFTPHHQYVGFYRWLRAGWGADAVIHVGMHGTAEWMPGLQLGLTAECWPDLLLGELPNLYLYPLNNPAEAAIARRRGYATIISHLVPPYARAGLYKQLAQLRSRASDLQARSGAAGVDLAAELAALELPELPRGAEETAASYLERLQRYLDQLEQRLILDGLHVFGTVPAPERAQALIESALDIPRDGRPGLAELLLASGVPATELPAARSAFVSQAVLHKQPPAQVWSRIAGPAPAGLEELLAQGQRILQGLRESAHELDVLLHALDGGYVRPAMGADPVRAGAAALPSGRNIHGIDPWRLPTPAGLQRGKLLAEALLRRHQEQHGATPRTVALTLWALDAIKSEGESLGAALWLVGAQPEYDGQGKIFRFALIPLSELGRPRVDLLLDISPIFRDTFQLSVDLLDQLFRHAAAADEPVELNAIRANVLELQQAGRSWEEATARIFTQAPGLYGTGVDERIDESAWESSTELVETYLQRNRHSYGGGRGGKAAGETLRQLLGSVDHVFQTIDSVEYGLTDMQHYYGHTGAIQLAAGQTRGTAVPLSYAESQSGSVKINGAQELLQIEARSKLLNPRWYEGLLAHGFAGAAEIGNRFTYLLGWSATSNIVEPWVFDAAAQTFVLDPEMRARLEQANPRAARNAVARLLEANARGCWPADQATLEQLQAIYADLEDRLEGIAVSGD